MGKKTRNINITIASVSGLPDCSEAGQIQVRYGNKSVMTSVKSPLRTGYSSDIMETFTFPVDGTAIQFDVFHVKSGAMPIVCSGGHVIQTAGEYSYDGPVTLLDKTGGLCHQPKLFVNLTIV